MAAGAIVVDVKKPGRIIVRNNMIISLSLCLSFNEVPSNRDGEEEEEEKREREEADQNTNKKKALLIKTMADD